MVPSIYVQLEKVSYGNRYVRVPLGEMCSVGDRDRLGGKGSSTLGLKNAILLFFFLGFHCHVAIGLEIVWKLSSSV